MKSSIINIYIPLYKPRLMFQNLLLFADEVYEKTNQLKTVIMQMKNIRTESNTEEMTRLKEQNKKLSLALEETQVIIYFQIPIIFP